MVSTILASASITGYWRQLQSRSHPSPSINVTHMRMQLLFNKWIYLISG